MRATTEQRVAVKIDGLVQQALPALHDAACLGIDGPRADHIRAVITAHLTQLPDLITDVRDDTGWADDFYQED
ncbi:hypothetical protein ACEE18_05690 [Corynebacterium freneyi]